MGKNKLESNEITNGLVSDLPEGWVWCRMEEIAQINPRHPLNVLPENIEASFLPMPNLNEDNWKIKENQKRPFGEIRKGYTHFAEEDVLFAKITPCMENGKAAIARNLINRIGCGTTELHVIRPHGGIPPEFIYHYIHQESFRQEAEACMTGTAGQLRVPVDFVASASIPIPPLQEQILIVNRIEHLLERTRKAKESLDKIPLIMKRFRQAVLKKAFSGELTTEWREQDQDLEPAAELLRRIQEEREHNYQVKAGQKRTNQLKKQEIAPLDTSELSDLPEGWIWSKASEIVEIKYGKGLKQENRKSGKFPVYGSNGIVGYHDQSLTHSPAIIIGRKGSVGEVNYSNIACWPIDTTYFIDKFVSVNSIYIYHLLSHSRLSELDKSTAIPGVNRDDIYSVIIPLPPLPEQQEIVRRIESLFKFAEDTEKNAAEARKRVELMTQSLLARAFRGDLSTDFRDAIRNWRDLDAEARGRYVFVLPEEEREKVLNADEFPMEPAGQLLQRIREGKEKNGNIGKSRRRKG